MRAKPLVILILLIGSIAPLMVQPPFVLASGENWLDGWTYRKSIEITGATGAGTDYQILLDLQYGYGIDIGNTIYLNSYSQTDFGDIRFTASDGDTELDYWIEDYIVSTSADVWVEVADSLESLALIYIYYGNSTVNTTSNGDNTFLQFSDFGRYFDLDTWNRYSAADDYVFAAVNSTSSSISTTGKCEGIAYDGTYYYLSTYYYDVGGESTAWIYKVNNAFSIVDYTQINESTLEHSGGMVLHDGYLYVPIAEPVQNPANPSKLQVYDASDLSFVETLADSSDYSDDHWAGVFIIEDLDRLYVDNWGTNDLYVFTIDGDYVDTITSPPDSDIQDFVYIEEDNLVYGSKQGGDSNIISVWKPNSAGSTFTKVGETMTDDSKTWNGLTWYNDYFYSCYQDPPLYIYKLYGSNLVAEIVDYYIYNDTTIGPNVMMETKLLSNGNLRFNVGFAQSVPTSGTQVIFHNYDGDCYFYEGNSDDDCNFDIVADEVTILSLGWVEDHAYTYKNRGSQHITNDDDISGTALKPHVALWGSMSGIVNISWSYIRKWLTTEPYVSSIAGKTTGWHNVNTVTLFFYSPINEWSFNAAFIILGLVMVPASTLYLVHGGRSSMSSKKLFYGLVAFFMGCALFIGGIMP